MSTTSPDPAAPMLVVAATGYLGSQVLDELLARGKNVRALVRPSTDATKLEAAGEPITPRTPRGKPQSSGSRRRRQ